MVAPLVPIPPRQDPPDQDFSYEELVGMLAGAVVFLAIGALLWWLGEEFHNLGILQVPGFVFLLIGSVCLIVFLSQPFAFVLFIFIAAIVGLAMVFYALGAAADDYEWPVAQVVDGATLIVDAGADLPPELAMLTVRIVGPGGRALRRDGGDVVAALLAGASKVVVRNPRYGDENCECQVVAEVLIDGESLAAAARGRE